MKNFDWLLKTPIAHRGLHDDKIPENSISAFKKAISKGYLIETDVRLSKDGKIVLFHDDDLLRVCGVNGKVCEFTYEELQSFHLQDSEEKIPLLSDLLDLAGETTGLLIELKSDGQGVLEKAVDDELKKRSGLYAVQSFHPYSVKWFKENSPLIPRGLLATANLPKSLNVFIRFALKNLLLYKKIEPDFISYDELSINRKLVQKKPVPILAWTIRSKERERELLKKDLAVNVIFENYLS